MGIDLRIHPVEALHTRGATCWGYAHTMIAVPLGGDLMSEINAIAVRLPAGHDVSTFTGVRIPDGAMKNEHAYGTCSTDGYGNPLCWVSAGQLGTLLAKRRPRSPVAAYVRALPSETKIIIEWH